MIPEIQVAVIGLSGVAIGSICTSLVTFINRKFDERRDLREAAIKCAISAWEDHVEFQKFKREATHAAVSILPLDTYIIHMVRLLDIATNTKLSPDEIEASLKKLHEVGGAAVRAAQKH